MHVENSMARSGSKALFLTSGPKAAGASGQQAPPRRDRDMASISMVILQDSSRFRHHSNQTFSGRIFH